MTTSSGQNGDAVTAVVRSVQRFLVNQDQESEFFIKKIDLVYSEKKF